MSTRSHGLPPCCPSPTRPSAGTDVLSFLTVNQLAPCLSDRRTVAQSGPPFRVSSTVTFTVTDSWSNRSASSITPLSGAGCRPPAAGPGVGRVAGDIADRAGQHTSSLSSVGVLAVRRQVAPHEQEDFLRPPVILGGRVLLAVLESRPPRSRRWASARPPRSRTRPRCSRPAARLVEDHQDALAVLRLHFWAPCLGLEIPVPHRAPSACPPSPPERASAAAGADALQLSPVRVISDVASHPCPLLLLGTYQLRVLPSTVSRSRTGTRFLYGPRWSARPPGPGR